MKRIFKSSFILLALLGVMFTSCKKEYEVPPIPVLPVGDVYTIGDLLAMPANTTFDTASVYGIVTADEQSGNLYKTIFIQDRSTGKAIELLMNTSSAARIGDSVRVFLDKNMIVNNYHNLPQLTGKDGKGFNPDGHLIIYPYNNPIEPTTVTIADIKTGNYTAGLVKLENVEFVDQGSAFCNIGENTNRTLKDATGELLVRTSNYANFAYDLLPVGQGSLVAIASVYNNDWQLVIRSKNEMHFEGGEPTPPAPPGEVQHLPYTQNFSSDFGTYTTYNVAGDQTWVIDYSTAKMTGYVNGTNYANEDWLISSPVEITGVSDAKMTIVYIGRYFTNINDEVTIWASTNYTWGSDPTTATWTQLATTLTEGTNWNNFLTAEIPLTEYVGRIVTFAVKYVSSDSKAGTMEIQSMCIEEGSAGGGGGGGGTGQGSGTFEDPYNVAAGIGLQSEKPIAWVQGYIVGAVRNGLSTVGSNDDVIWSAPFDSYTNVVIADDATCHEISQCIIVNLPSGKPLRAQVNLYDNPDNLGKQLAVLGKLRTYFGQAGLRDSEGTEADFVLEGGVTPPPGPGTQIFSETFASGQGAFTIQDVVLPSGLSYVWQHAPSYSCMKASAYVSGQNYASESWLVSPAISLTGVNAATLKFEQAVNYASPQGALSVMVSTNYTGDVTTATWTTLALNEWPAGNNWTFVNSTADLTPFVGQSVTIAFKYTSTSSASATWEVKNFVVE